MLRLRVSDLIASRGKKQEEVSAGFVPGFRYLQYKSGKHRWLLRYIDPKSKKRDVHMLGGGTMALAVAEAVKVRALLAEGRSPLEGRITVGRYFDEYYRPWVEAKLASALDSVARFNMYIRPVIGDAILADLRLPVLKALIAKLPDRLAASTKRHVAAVVKAMLRRAHEDGFVDVNLGTGIRLEKPHNARDRRASWAEIRAIYDAIKLEQQPSLPGLLIRLLFSTAMRSGEARALKFEDIDIEKKCLMLRRTKNGKPREVKLNSEALAVIVELQQFKKGEYLFPGCGGKIMERPTKAWNRILKRAGLQDNPLTLHDIRGSALSIGVNAGVGMFDLATLAGHSNIQTTYDYYLKSDDAASRRTSELLASSLPTY